MAEGRGLALTKVVMDANSKTSKEFHHLSLSAVVRSNEEKPNRKKRFSFVLQFMCKCPEASEVKKLHPAIQRVFVPHRPASVNYCILHFSSEQKKDEVRKALHMKRVEPFKGKLLCRDTTKNILNKHSGMEEPTRTDISSLDVKMIRNMRKHQGEATEDVICNSTARELLVRYGMLCLNHEASEKVLHFGSHPKAQKIIKGGKKHPQKKLMNKNDSSKERKRRARYFKL